MNNKDKLIMDIVNFGYDLVSGVVSGSDVSMRTYKLAARADREGLSPKEVNDFVSVGVKRRVKDMNKEQARSRA